MSMFDRYPQRDDYIPDNRPKCCKHFELNIMSGETAVHSFDVPFDIEDACDSVEVIYSLGIKPILIKKDPEIIITHCDHSIVTCKLNEQETLLFDDTLLSAQVQLKFYMKNGTTTYSEIYRIKLMDSLDANSEINEEE